MYSIVLTIVWSAFIVFLSHSQNAELRGSLNVRNYASTEYNGHTQVFSITQDGRGIMYFGNKAGVLEYDGTNWRTIKVLNENGDSREVNSLATDSKGKVYVAAKEDFGFLEADKKGIIHFHSLKHLLKTKLELKIPKSIITTHKGVFFHYDNVIICYANNQLKTWDSNDDDAFYGLFYANDKIYAAKLNSGLYSLSSNTFVKSPNGGRYTHENKIYAITNFSGKTYIQTSEGSIDDYSNPSQVVSVKLAYTRPSYNAINVLDQYYSSGTFSDGVLIYDRNFNLSCQVDLSNGLIDGNVNCQYLDKEGNIWVGTNKGISKIDVISPISRFGINFGMISGVEGVCSFKGKVYYATLSGVYFLNDHFQTTSERIKKVPGLNIDCYGLKTVVFGKDTILLVAANNGVWMLKNHSSNLEMVAECGPYNFVQSPINQNEVFVANYDGLSHMHWTGSGFVDDGYIKGFSEDIFNISVEKNGTLWLGTIENGIIKSHVNFKTKSGKIKKEIIGSPKDGPAYISLFNNQIYVGNDKGLFELVNGKLIPSTTYKLPKKCGVHRLMMDKTGKLWAILALKNNKFEIGFFENDAQHTWNSKDFHRYTSEIIHGLFNDEKSMTWLGGPNGLMLYNPKIKKDYSLSFNTLIRNITIGDSIVFGGAFYNHTKLPGIAQGKSTVLRIPYSSKSVNFEFAATSFIDEASTVYSYKLDGQDEDWSAWSTKTEKSYTNLYEGEYTFLVKSKNIYGKVTTISSFKFEILPPWYRTIWAYIFYVFSFIFFIYIAIKLGNRRIRVQKEHLEEIVKVRTAEVVEQKAEIEHQKEIVERKNRDITDSIKYAKRLQDAILPTDEYIKSCLEETFVFFRPKDIVSGDFYWFKKVENKVFFAAVDCTGHGVPGAFVSIVGNNGMNRALKEYGLTKPSEILDKLSELVEEAFIQKGHNEVRDGMDIALCCIDLTTNILQFSGANNPLYIISNGDLTEIKGNKQPVGPYSDKVPFTNHEIQLKKGDMLVLFSDGFADQFGGPLGKKYKYAKFKQFLLNHSNESMDTLSKNIVAEFESWIQHHEQIDDVCVVGVRI